MNQETKLFLKDDGKPYSDQKTLGKVFSKACKRVGLHYSPHDVRRKATQDMAFKHNIPLPIIAEILGHNPRDIETLMTSYCLVQPNQSIEAMKNIAD